MEDILKKISQYQLFNFLLSGSVLVVLLSKTTPLNFTTDDALTMFFIFYFAGLVISRIGSILVEPALKKLKIIVFAPYDEYLDAVKADPKIDTLSQENNTYRTLIATFLVFIAVYLINKFASHSLQGKSQIVIIVLAITLLVLFVFAYRKQTEYITKRVSKTKGQ